MRMMKRRDLAWVTDEHGEVVRVGIAEIDETRQVLVCTATADADDGETLHIAGIRLPVAV